MSFKWLANVQPTYLSSDTIPVPYCTPPEFLDAIQYKLILTGKGGCSVADSIKVIVLHQPKPSNAFSPNGDAYNQTWHIDNIDAYPDAVIEVFNRYGQRVYRSVGYNNGNGWNGTVNGQPLPEGVYYYTIMPRNGQAIISGSVTIIR